jgi:hypothetical protein
MLASSSDLKQFEIRFMKHLLLMIAVASFAFAGAVQKEQPKQAPAKRTTTSAKKTPTPTKKSTATAKKSTTPTKKADPVAMKGTDKKSDSTKKIGPSKQKSSNATAKATTNKKVPAPSKTTAVATNAKPKPKPTPAKKDDKGDLEKALAIEDPDQKINALKEFLTDFPKSDLRTRAKESLTAARVAFGDANFEAGDPEYGLKLIRAAMREAPVPYPEKLFVEIISKVPSALYLHGERAAAIEAAAAIEKNSTSSVPQLLAVANFYLSPKTVPKQSD